MELQIKMHLSDNLVESKEVADRIVKENLETKLDHYLNKFDKKDAEGTIELNLEKNKKDLFNGKLNIFIDGKKYIYEREDYKKLDDLINHLFDHFKLELSK